MSLRSKIVLVLLTVVLLYAGLDNGLHRALSRGVFGRWEEEEAKESLGRALSAYRAEEETLRTQARIWAARDEIWRLVTTEDATLSPRVLEDSRVDVFYVCDPSGRVRWSRAVDPRTGEEMRLSQDLPSESLSLSHPLLNVESGESDRVGLMMTAEMPLVVVSTPIPDETGVAFVDQDGGSLRFEQASHGYVILGRFIGHRFSERIKVSAGVDLHIREATDQVLDDQGEDILARLTSGEANTVSRVGEDDKLHLYSTITDMRSLQPLLFEASLERRITAYGRKVVNYALLSSLMSVLLFVFVLLMLLQRIVLNPLGTLTSKAVEIGKKDDSTIRVDLERSDEIGTLATEFDAMLDKLAHSRNQVVKTARMAGMSEIATGVLHNVGNVLNSVNVSASLLRRGVDKLGIDDLQRLVGVLEEKGDGLARFIAEDPRGQHTLPFLSEITEAVARGKAEIQSEVGAVIEGIDHISDLVRSQQTYAGTKGVFELASLADEVDAALRICTQADGALAGLEVVREFDELPTVSVDKHKLMEVLVNLIQNASQALRGVETRRLTLRVFEATPGIARIEVQDTGMGIPAENLQKVFHHGFTTKDNGHGFGLHTSANAATEMNASLDVRSDGPGEGATFFLDIPMSSDELASAA